jgi:hypothetical protein
MSLPQSSRSRSCVSALPYFDFSSVNYSTVFPRHPEYGVELGNIKTGPTLPTPALAWSRFFLGTDQSRSQVGLTGALIRQLLLLCSRPAMAFDDGREYAYERDYGTTGNRVGLGVCNNLNV